MAILDKLLEKKDVLLYIDTRIAELRTLQKKCIEETKKEDREEIHERFIGRI